MSDGPEGRPDFPKPRMSGTISRYLEERWSICGRNASDESGNACRSSTGSPLPWSMKCSGTPFRVMDGIGSSYPTFQLVYNALVTSPSATELLPERLREVLQGMGDRSFASRVRR